MAKACRQKLVSSVRFCVKINLKIKKIMYKKLTLIFLSVFVFTNNDLFAQDEFLNKSPNFIVISTDDLGYGDVGSVGSELIQTPHIESNGKRRCSINKSLL